MNFSVSLVTTSDILSNAGAKASSATVPIVKNIFLTLFHAFLNFTLEVSNLPIVCSTTLLDACKSFIFAL